MTPLVLGGVIKRNATVQTVMPRRDLGTGVISHRHLHHDMALISGLCNVRVDLVGDGRSLRRRSTISGRFEIEGTSLVYADDAVG